MALKASQFLIVFLILLALLSIGPCLFFDSYGHDKEFWAGKLDLICSWSDNPTVCKQVLCKPAGVP